MEVRHRRDRGGHGLGTATRRRLHDGAGVARRDRGPGAAAEHRRPTRSPSPTASMAARCGPRSIRRCRSCSAGGGRASSRTGTPRSCASTARLAGCATAFSMTTARASSAGCSRSYATRRQEAEKLTTRPWSDLELGRSPALHARARARLRSPSTACCVKGLVFDGKAGLLLYRPAHCRRSDPVHAPVAPRPRARRPKVFEMTYVLGLNAFHADAAACLVKDGELVAAVEEERFRRIKHWGGFPSESIRYCLDEAGISLARRRPCRGQQRQPGEPLAQARLRPDVRRRVPAYVLSRLRHRGERADVAGNLERDLPEQEFRGTVHAVEHHLCHLASAFLVSPYDEAVAVSVDGFGDFSVGGLGTGRGRQSAGRRPRLLPAFAGRVLRGDDAVHRLSRTTATSTR